MKRTNCDPSFCRQPLPLYFRTSEARPAPCASVMHEHARLPRLVLSPNTHGRKADNIQTWLQREVSPLSQRKTAKGFPGSSASNLRDSKLKHVQAFHAEPCHPDQRSRYLYRSSYKPIICILVPARSCEATFDRGRCQVRKRPKGCGVPSGRLRFG
jgi:hypothetical protein